MKLVDDQGSLNYNDYALKGGGVGVSTKIIIYIQSSFFNELHMAYDTKNWVILYIITPMSNI